MGKNEDDEYRVRVTRGGWDPHPDPNRFREEDKWCNLFTLLFLYIPYWVIAYASGGGKTAFLHAINNTMGKRTICSPLPNGALKHGHCPCLH
ncbi:MAG TPA: hypothetical protein PKZ16_02155 [bacterium]|nr:hypothetical protein [bacterium]HPL95636.1 hypothetical protein [bacterium]